MKIIIGKTYLYNPTDKMDYRKGGPGFIQPDDDELLRGREVLIVDKTIYPNKYRGEFVNALGGVSYTFTFVAECLKEKSKTNFISHSPKNKPRRDVG